MDLKQALKAQGVIPRISALRYRVKEITGIYLSGETIEELVEVVRLCPNVIEDLHGSRGLGRRTLAALSNVVNQALLNDRGFYLMWKGHITSGIFPSPQDAKNFLAGKIRPDGSILIRKHLGEYALDFKKGAFCVRANPDDFEIVEVVFVADPELLA